MVPEGTQDVPVNQLIAVLAEEGEDVKAAAAAGGEGRGACKGRESGNPLTPTLSPNGEREHTERAATDATLSTVGATSFAASTGSTLSPAGRGWG